MPKTALEVLDLVIEDIEKDVKDMEGAPFTGQVVAQHFGYLRAQVQAIAKALKKHLEEEQE